MPAMRATGYLCSIAGKPAPTGEWQCTPLFSTQLPQGNGNFSDDSTSVGAGLPAMRVTGVCVQSLASQLPQGSGSAHHCSAHSSHSGSGNFSAHSKSVGAWLASDEGDWMSLFNRWQASSHKTQCPQGIFGGLSDQKLAGVLALMISASSAPIFLKRWGSVVGK